MTIGLEKLVAVHQSLKTRNPINWDDIGKAYFGRDYDFRRNETPNLLVVFDAEKGEIIEQLERSRKIKYFETEGTRQYPEDHLMFTHISQSQTPYPHIQISKLSLCGIPTNVSLHYLPNIANCLERDQLIAGGKVPQFPYIWNLGMETAPERPVFEDTFEAVLNFLQHLERSNKPFWVHSHHPTEGPKGKLFLEFPEGIRFVPS